MVENEDEQRLTADEEGSLPVRMQGGISKKMILLIACLCALCDCLLLSVIVPIIPVYLDANKMNSRLPVANNLTKNNSSASGSPSVIYDSSMDFKIGALFASKAFVQIVVNPLTGYLTESLCLCRQLWPSVFSPSNSGIRLFLYSHF